MIDLPKSDYETMRINIVKARAVVFEMCSHTPQWFMSGRPQSNYDLAQAITDATTLLARVEALEKANMDERGVWSQLYNALSGDESGSYSVDDLRRVVAKLIDRLDALEDVPDVAEKE